MFSIQSLAAVLSLRRQPSQFGRQVARSLVYSVPLASCQCWSGYTSCINHEPQASFDKTWQRGSTRSISAWSRWLLASG